MSKKEIISSQELEQAKEIAKKGLKTTLGIGCYNSETDNEIGRSKEHTKHMKRTRRQNFARKMKLIDPHYGKKAAGVLAAGTALGLAATTVPGIGAALGPTVGGAVIAGGLVFLETDAHRAVGDHAILDSLLDDRDDNWRTNASLHGYDGHGDNISEFDRQQMLAWSDSEDEDDDLDSLLPSSMGGGERKKESLVSSNPLFDAIEESNTPQPQQDFFSSMESLGLTDTKPITSGVPRPPSPELGGSGQRFTNPHSSATVQNMGNNNLPLDLFAPQPQQPQQDDFFASMSTPAPLTVSPTPSSINETKMKQDANPKSAPNNSNGGGGNDFFANFPNDSNSFFTSVASAIPTTNPQGGKPKPAEPVDPFADLYSRPASNKPTPASNYNALHGMNRF